MEPSGRANTRDGAIPERTPVVSELHSGLGPINSERPAGVRFGTHSGPQAGHRVWFEKCQQRTLLYIRQHVAHFCLSAAPRRLTRVIPLPGRPLLAASSTPMHHVLFRKIVRALWTIRTPANRSLTQASPPAASRLRDWRDAPAAGSGSKRQAWRYETRDQACANGPPPLEPYPFVRQARDMRR
jgi:hypothetical protein